MSLFQTLATAFKGRGGRIPLSNNMLAGWLMGDAGEAPPYDYARAVRQAYLQNPVAQRAVRLIADGIAGAPLLPTADGLVALVRATSAGQSLLETLTSQLLLHGNAYIQILKDAGGAPVELFALRPERVSLVQGKDGWPTALTYRVGQQTQTIPLLDGDASPNVIHIRGFHPCDDHYGAGCLSAADQAIATHNAAARWNRTLLENAARPSGALVYNAAGGTPLSADQFARLKEEMTLAFTSSINAGRPLVLEGGLSWQALSMSPTDMDFANLKAAAARDIALAFGVPPMLLGLPGDSTHANYREANRALWRLTLLPFGAKLFGAIAEGLETWFPDASLAIDLDHVPALADDRAALWSQVTSASFLSPDEQRGLVGLPPAGGQYAEIPL